MKPIPDLGAVTSANKYQSHYGVRSGVGRVVGGVICHASMSLEGAESVKQRLKLRSCLSFGVQLVLKQINFAYRLMTDLKGGMW